ncbi:hypothetical protein K439DRAFT_1622370 [Ramaria rubella]|nr:hypothetical protein K439DRAFT_1622370 [Ramaria rubella]
MASYINQNHSLTLQRFSLHLRSQSTKQSYKDELFAPCHAMQACSSNLMFYDHAEGAVVEYPYPMSGGRFINPAGMSKYLERHRQVFECWCSLLLPNVPVFVAIWTMTHRPYTSCDKCGLNVSLDEIFETTSMTADYPSFDKNGATMPASSPMSKFAAHRLATQPRQHGSRRHHSTVGYLATAVTPESNNSNSKIMNESTCALVKPPFDIQVAM